MDGEGVAIGRAGLLRGLEVRKRGRNLLDAIRLGHDGGGC